MAPTEGLVMALYGPWGSGKSTVVNFVVHAIEALPESDRPVVLNFNPWWFGGHEDLIRRFFDQLMITLKKRGVVTERVRRAMANLADIVAQVPLTEVSAGARIFSRIARPKARDVVELRRSVENALRDQPRKILVILDDIDRLSTEETREVFRLVKSVANFPNVVYFLAFDKNVAIQAVGSVQGVTGEEYLEKIIQVPFELPLPDKSALRKLFFERLNMILASTPDGAFDQTYWQNVYMEGVDHFITSPRDVARLSNTLSVTYPAVQGEVNAVDFIAVETLRVFTSELYQVIRQNPESFAGASSGGFGADANVDRLRSFHDAWLENVDAKDRVALKAVARRIFPRLEAVWSNTYYGSESLGRWRKELRVCSPDIFPTLFRLAVPEGGISNTEMGAILTSTKDASEFSEALLELSASRRPDGTTRLATFLERMEDYTRDDIQLEQVSPIMSALFDVGDELLRADPGRPGMFGFGLDTRMGRIVHQLIRRVASEQVRFEILIDAIQTGRALTFSVHEIIVLGQEHGRHSERNPSPEEQRIVSEQHLNDLEALCLNKIRSSAKDGTLIEAPELSMVLFLWGGWSDFDEPRQWVEEICKDDHNLLNILSAFVGVSFRHTLGDVSESTHYSFNLEALTRLIDPATVVERVSELARRPDLPVEQERATKAFLRAVERGDGDDEDDSD